MTALAIAVAVVNKILQKADRDEYTLFVTLAGVIIAILMILPQVNELRDTLSGIIEF